MGTLVTYRRRDGWTNGAETSWDGRGHGREGPAQIQDTSLKGAFTNREFNLALQNGICAHPTSNLWKL